MVTQSTTAGANVAGASFSIDPKEINSLRQSARQNSPEALKAVAQQFEGLFMNMVMKSMRDATPKDGLMDSEQGKMFGSMLDQQLSQNLAKRGVGLADVLIRQLSNNRGVAMPDGGGLPAGINGTNGTNGGAKANGTAALDALLPGRLRIGGAVQVAALQAGIEAGLTSGADNGLGSNLDLSLSGKAVGGLSAFQSTLQNALDGGIPGVLRAAFGAVKPAIAAADPTQAAVRSRSQPAHVRAFEDKLAVHAEEAARSTGVPAKFMLGQAALESGWGKREILTADGSSSHNVFGIKAGASWKGKVVETATTEYVNGVPERRIERFRSYDSYADAFRDYAKTLTNNPRYQAVLANATDIKGFAQGLQRAGYATDPHYAAKLTQIITRSLSA
ncbi:MAG: flagellar assembly peptidoglycan hydrolase FlgJ [Herminiimonas sp.]|nr:flagellar assembly peptidoglycan hydrolase FlgJ [Herminiimonas sp.]